MTEDTKPTHDPETGELLEQAVEQRDPDVAAPATADAPDYEDGDETAELDPADRPDELERDRGRDHEDT